MASTRYATKHIEDVVANNIPKHHIDALIDIAIHVLGKLAPTLARTAEFDLADFELASRQGLAGYTLRLTRERLDRQMWRAEFTSGNRSLDILISIDP